MKIKDFLYFACSLVEKVIATVSPVKIGLDPKQIRTETIFAVSYWDNHSVQHTKNPPLNLCAKYDFFGVENA